MKFAGAVWAALRGKRSTARHDVDEEYNMATALFKPPHGSPAWFHACVQTAQHGPVMETVELTPALASEMLKNNDSNRGIRVTKVAQYASDIAAGKWAFNGEPIIISKDGKVNDGQHRATAVIDANTAIKTIMIFGMDRDTRTTVDQGSARTASDYLGMDGVENSTALAAIARMVLSFEANEGTGFGGSHHVSNAEIMARVGTDARLVEAAHYAVGPARKAGTFCTGSILGFAYYVLSGVHAGEARAFLDQVSFGEHLTRGDAAHTLREKLVVVGKSRDRKAALILRAWNFYRRGMKVKPNSLHATLPFPALI